MTIPTSKFDDLTYKRLRDALFLINSILGNLDEGETSKQINVSIELLIEFLVDTRKKLLLTQQMVADKMGTTQSSVSDLESLRVEPRFGTLQRYANAVGYNLKITVAPKRPNKLDNERETD